ncbi:MAG: hypothetical protein ACO4CU_11285 [Ilumatobacteraceae bacterium]
MGASASFERPTLPVAPGANAEVRLRVRNTGSVVDSFSFEPVGVPSGWVTVEPAELRLFPATEEFVTVSVHPPRSSETPLGDMTFAMRVISAEDPTGSVAEELTLIIGEFGQRFGELHPRTSTGRTKGVHELAVDNFGNTPITPTFVGVEPDNLLSIEVKPPSVRVEPGTASIAIVTVRPRRRFWRGQPKSIPFKIAIGDPAEGDAAAPELIDGNFVQQPMVPKWLWKALVAVLALLILAWLLWKTVLEPSVQSAARDSVEEFVADEVEQLDERLDAAGIPELPAGGGVDTTTTSVPLVVPVTSPSTTVPSTDVIAPSSTTTTTTTIAPPIGSAGPFDFRLELLDQPGGDGASAQFGPVVEGTRLEVTDIVFQNPTGATGEIQVFRDGEQLFGLQLANFRDLDYHFVAPYVFDPGESIRVVLLCQTQGTLQPLNDAGSPGACRAAVSFAGFAVAPG